MTAVRVAGFLSLLLAGVAPQAEAAFVDVLVRGNCVRNCSNLGAERGDRFAGFVRIDSGKFAPNAVVDAVVDYSFSVGAFSMSKADEFVSGNAVFWTDTPGEFSGIRIFAYASGDPQHPGPLMSYKANWQTSVTGYVATDGFWFLVDGSFDPAGGGNGGIVRTHPLNGDPDPVPLPAAGWLLGAALLGLGAIRGRRAAGA